MASVGTSIVPPGPRPPPADTPGTTTPITTPQVTALHHDFAVSLGWPPRTAFPTPLRAAGTGCAAGPRSIGCGRHETHGRRVAGRQRRSLSWERRGVRTLPVL